MRSPEIFSKLELSPDRCSTYTKMKRKKYVSKVPKLTFTFIVLYQKIVVGYLKLFNCSL